MSTTAYSLVLGIHILFGIAGLVAFWLPAMTKKGGTAHKRVGRVFFYSASMVALTGVAMAALLLVDPLGARPPADGLSPERLAAVANRTRQFVPFLMFLVLITFTPVYHGVRVLETRRTPERLRTRFHTAVNAAAIAAGAAMVVLSVWWSRPVFAALSPIGFLVGIGQLRYARRRPASHMAWWYEHMGAMIGGGIAFHTAFFVLGAARLTGVQFSGAAGVLPWIVPALVGIPASAIWVRHYRRKFGDLEPRPGSRLVRQTAAGPLPGR